MSVPISTVVDVSISLQTQPVTQAGFGTGMILTNETPISSWGSELIRSYASTTEVLEDWTSTDEVYLAAVAYFGQTPSPTTLKVGLETTRVAQVTTITFDANFVTGNTIGAFDFSVGGLTQTITSTAFTSDNATTLAAITSKIDALSEFSASDNGSDTITITSAVAGVSFTTETPVVTGGASQAVATVATTTPNTGPAESMAAISEQDDDFYGVIWIERTVGLVYGMVSYIETVRKIFGTISSAAGTLSAVSTTDIGYLMNAASLNRSYWGYNADPTDYMESAWKGRCFPYDPGSITWHMQTLSTITADNLSSSQRSAVNNKNGNMFLTIRGSNVTFGGRMASGEYIDTIRGADWLQARMQESILQKLVSSKKVPFTNQGIAIIEAEVRAQLENAIRVGFLSNDPLDPDSNDPDRANFPYIVTVPDVSDVSSADKANRSLTGVSFEAKAAGAFHSVTISGTITA